MKTGKLTLLLCLSLLGLSAQARKIGGYEKAMKVKGAIAPQAFSIQGVNAIGLTACDARSGTVDTARGDVYCVVIGTETEAAADLAEKRFPSGSSVNGVYVWVEVIGKIVRH